MVESAQGLDVSNWQPPLTAQVIAGKKFILCKATEGPAYTDITFARNWAFLDSYRSRGVIRGAYHYFHPGVSAWDQAAFFTSTVLRHGLQHGDILMIDAEIAAGLDGTLITPRPSAAGPRSNLTHADSAGRVIVNPGSGLRHRMFRRSLPPKMTATLVGQAAADFLRYVADAVNTALGGDYCPVICYTYENFLPQMAPCTGYPLFIAYYSSRAPGTVAPWDSWKIWQWAGGGGPSGADQDAYNGTAADMDAWIATYTGKPPAPRPAPAPNWTETLMAELPELRQGATGDDVKTVQGLLCARGNLTSIDGAYGPKTTAAAEAFQRAHGLTSDGITGPLTWPKLLNR